jgi:hypothetical protein
LLVSTPSNAAHLELAAVVWLGNVNYDSVPYLAAAISLLQALQQAAAQGSNLLAKQQLHFIRRC